MPIIYELMGIMVHRGSYHGGHYIAVSKRDGEWLKFNDERISNVKSERHILQNKAYVLIYKTRYEEE